MSGPNDRPGDSTEDTAAPDAQDLARRFVDLWQSQVQAMATDPEVADAMRRWGALWTGRGLGPARSDPDRTMPDGLQPGYARDARSAYDARHDAASDHARSAASPPTAGAAPAAPVSDDGGNDLAVVLRELRRLEERIARLEARFERDGGDPEIPTRRARSGKGRARG